MAEPSDDSFQQPTPEERARLRTFLESGGRVVGAVAGVAVGLVTDPVLGAGAGSALQDVFARVGVELHGRLLAKRQGARAAGALDVAWVRFNERLGAGDTPRRDGFFDAGGDGRIDAEEVLEGALLAAANAYEERKVPYIGRLYANLAFDSSVSAAHASFLLRLADRLTYRQLQLLSFFGETQSRSGEQILGVVTVSGEDPEESGLAELNDLSAARRWACATTLARLLRSTTTPSRATGGR